MKKEELIALLDGLNWYPAGRWRLVKITNIEFTPKVKFDISHHNYAKLIDEKRDFIDQWNVGFVIHGCESGLVFDKPEQVKAYILRQCNRLPEYLTLTGKRERLAERIAPLQKKWFRYGDEIFELAKET